MYMVTILEPVKFQWDSGNTSKNFLKHKVTLEECEQIFITYGNFIFDDPQHSASEPRYVIIGLTQNKRLLFIAFTIRGQFIRVISARNADKKERKLYEQATQITEI